MKGQWLKDCNCAYGCPSNFNALPPRANLETKPEQTKPPVTGVEDRILVVMPGSFEHHETEIATAPTLKANGGIRFSHKNSTARWSTSSSRRRTSSTWRCEP
jgi:hypothetical protein